MPTRTKTVITGLSAAALVATISYAFAQSSDDSALANSNFNGAQNSADTTLNGPPAMPSEAAAAMPAGSETPSTATATTIAGAQPVEPSAEASEQYGHPAVAPSDERAPSSDTMGPSTSPTATDPNIANPTPGTTQNNTDMSNNPTASPSGAADTSSTATHVDLNSPNEQQYNLESNRLRQRNDAIVSGSPSGASDGATSGQRAPRADRN